MDSSRYEAFQVYESTALEDAVAFLIGMWTRGKPDLENLWRQDVVANRDPGDKKQWYCTVLYNAASYVHDTKWDADSVDPGQVAAQVELAMNKLLILEPRHYQAAYRRGDIAYDQQDWWGAIFSYTLGLEIIEKYGEWLTGDQPGVPMFYAALGFAMRGRAHAANGEKLLAYNDYVRAAETSPGFKNKHFPNGMIHAIAQIS